MELKNLFAALPPDENREHFEPLLEAGSFLLERIVSHGQATPPGEWLQQEREEWVVLLRGGAELRFEDEPAPRRLQSGDVLLISSGRRHRVEWTAPGEATVWLALHFDRR